MQLMQAQTSSHFSLYGRSAASTDDMRGTRNVGRNVPCTVSELEIGQCPTSSFPTSDVLRFGASSGTVLTSKAIFSSLSWGQHNAKNERPAKLALCSRSEASDPRRSLRRTGHTRLMPCISKPCKRQRHDTYIWRTCKLFKEHSEPRVSRLIAPNPRTHNANSSTLWTASICILGVFPLPVICKVFSRTHRFRQMMLGGIEAEMAQRLLDDKLC